VINSLRALESLRGTATIGKPWAMRPARPFGTLSSPLQTRPVGLVDLPDRPWTMIV
jgi:hypothetical protein